MSQKRWLAIFIAAMFFITPFSTSINGTSKEETKEEVKAEANPNYDVEFNHPWDIEFIESASGVEIWAQPNEETYPTGIGVVGWTYLSHSNQKIEGEVPATLILTAGIKLTSITQLPSGIGQLRAWLILEEVVGESVVELNVEGHQISIIDPNTNPEGEFYQIAKSERLHQQNTIGKSTPIPEIASSFIPLSTSNTSGRTTIQITYDADSLPSSPWQGGIGTANNTSELGWGVTNYTYTEGTGALWSSGYNYNNSTSMACVMTNCTYDNNTYTGVYASLSLASYTNATDLNLTFDVNYSLESGYDFFQVYGATNSSAWTQLGNYTGTSSGWTTETINLLNFSGNSNFELYFIMVSDSSVISGHGAFLDDIMISGNTSSTATYPDLVADGIWATTSATLGTSYSVNAEISNIGSAASGSFLWSVYLYNTSTGNYTGIKSYNANSFNSNTSTNTSISITIPSSITPGAYYWALFVDSNYSITELNESNNLVYGNGVTITSSSTGNIDIIADSIYYNGSSSSLCAGGGINVQRGFSTNPSTTTSFEYGIYLSTNNIISTSDTQIYNYSSSWSSSNQTIGLTIPSNISTGNYYLGLIVDPSNSVNETSESNNYVASNTTISIDNSPDLEAISISGPTATTPGSSVSISRTFENSGCASSSSFRYGVYLSTNNIISTGDTLVSNRTFTALSAGSTSSQSVSFTLSSSIGTGTYYWGIILDPYNQISESNENNNDKADSNSATITGSGYVTVTAKFQYYNYDLANNSACGSTCYSGARFMKAELWDQDTVSSDDLLATSYLDYYGNVKFSNIVVSEIGTNQDIYIKLYAYNNAAEVSTASGSSNAQGTAYTWTTSVVTNVASGVYSYGTQSVTTNGGALHIASIMMDSRNYVNTYASSSISQLDVRWPNAASTGAYYYWVGGAHVVLYDGFGTTVIFHEYGHYVDDYYASHTGGGGPHSFNACTSEDLGWGEGWASYFAIAVKNRYNYLDDTWYKDWYEYEEGLLSGGYRNYNANGDATVNNPSNGTHWDCLEEVVTGILWDIHDGVDDDSWVTDGFGDTLGSYNRQYAQTIWDSALGYNPTHDFTLADFTYSFLSNNPSAKEQYFDILVDHAIRPELSCSSSYDDASEAGSSGDAGSSTSTSKSLWANNSDEIYTYHGCLTTSTDNRDYYSVTIPSGKELKAVLVSPGNNDFDISIVNSTNSYLAGSSNTFGMEWANWSSYSSSSQTVYVVIDRYSGSGSMYGLTIELVNKTNPNLVANWIGAPTLIHPGSTITATIAMSNTGGNSGPFNYGIYLSTDGNITPSDTRLYSGYYSSYCANCQSNFSVSVSIPSSLTTGSTYYWGLYVDYGYTVSETSGSDNDYTGVQTTVGCGITQNDGGWGGDFGNNISTSNWTGYAPTMTLNGCMDNNDTVDYLVLGLNSGYDVDIRLTDTNLSDFDIELMYYSNSTSIDQSTSGNNIDWVSTLGTNASGNSAFLVIKIYRYSGAGSYNLDIWSNATYLSDLEPTYLYGPDWANPGQPVYVWREITNNGKLYSGQFNYSIYLSSDTTITTSDYLLDNFTQSPGIAYMDWNYTNASFTIPNTIPPGTYYWGIIVDGENAILEDNESNNAYYGNDVEILACNYQQDDAGQGSDAPSSYDFPHISVSSGAYTGCLDYVDDEDTYTISTGANTRLEVTITSPSGSDFEMVMIDSSGYWAVGNTTSNGEEASMVSVQGDTYTIVVYNPNYEMGGDYSLTINVVQLADVTINSILVSNTAQAGSTISVNMMVENLGSEHTSQFSVETYLSKDHYIDSSDDLIHTSQKGVISSGQQSPHNLNIPLDDTISEGPYYLCVSLNPDKMMEESQYWNNWECKGIFVTTPDLTTPLFVTQNNSITNQSSYSVEWGISTSANIPISGYYLVVNGQTTPMITGTSSMINLLEGTNFISVYAINSVGTNSDLDQISITLDTIIPNAPELPFTTSIIGKPGVFSLSIPHCTDNFAIHSSWMSYGNGWEMISLNGVSESLDSGITNLEFRCQDLAGNFGPISVVEVTTDLDSPSAPVVESPSGWIAPGTHTFSIIQTSDVGTGVSTTQYSINGGEWRRVIDDSVDLHFVTDNHTISFRSIDFAENAGGSTTIELYVDNTMPDAPIIEIGQYYQSTNEIVANLSVTGSEHTYYTWTLDGGLETTENGSAIELGQLAEGTHELSVVSWDQVGNPSESARVQFIVDDSPPNPPRIYCSSTWYTTNLVSCAVEAPYDMGSGISHLQKQVADKPWESINLADIEEGTINMQLSDGEYEISFRWVDILGQNSEITTHTILVDTTPPEMVVVQNGIIDLYVADGLTKVIIANLTIDITENGSGVVAIIYSLDGGATWNYYSSEGGIVAPNGMAGQQIVKFMIIDYAGNQGTSTETITFAGDDPDLVITEPAGMFGDTNSALIYGGALFVIIFGLSMVILYRKK